MPDYDSNEFTNNELKPKLVAELKNTDKSFMGVIPNAMDEAIHQTDGIKINKIKRVSKGARNRTEDFTSDDIVKHDAKGKTIPWESLHAHPFEIDKDELRDTVWPKNQERRVQLTDTMQDQFARLTLENILPEDGSNPKKPIYTPINGAGTLITRDFVNVAAMMQYELKCKKTYAHRMDYRNKDAGWYFYIAPHHKMALQMQHEETREFRDWLANNDMIKNKFYDFSFIDDNEYSIVYDNNDIMVDIDATNPQTDDEPKYVLPEGYNQVSFAFWAGNLVKGFGELELTRTPRNASQAIPADLFGMHAYAASDCIEDTGIIIIK